MMQRPFLDVKPSATGGASAARIVAANLGVALGYAVTGYAGLRLAFIGDAVTLFWPPTGIAFAALWLGGFRLLPGVMFGAFVVMANALGAVAPALLVAVGNALPAVVGTIVLRRMIARRGDPGELWRVLAFILVAALAATTLSASIGTLAVWLDGNIGTSAQSTWPVYWMGDAMGVLIVAPPLLLWERFARRFAWRRLFEALMFGLAGLGIIAGLLLIRDPVWAVELCKLATLLLSLWAGARFGLAGPAAMTLLMAVGAVTVTALGVGPFIRASFYDSFALVHSYLFATAIAGMLLAAALSDLRRIAEAETRARAAADAASVDRIRLLTMISHDVRTPLSGIIGVLATLERARLDDEQARLVGLASRAGGVLTTLVADILDVARADAGRIVLVPAPFSPGRSLADVVDLNRPVAAAKGLEIAVSGAAALPARVLGDRARFEQLLGNLVTNAIAYTEIGRVGVHAAWDAAAALPLVVEVVDSGPGIDPERVPRMFDAFVLDPRPGNPSAGLGLGLHICRRLVELMGGSITYRRSAAGGSIFEVALPSAAVAGGAVPAENAVEAALAVLLVEDDPIAQEVTAAMLRGSGHSVSVAATVDAAVRLASTAGFDLVLMDLQLAAGESGIEGARRIRQLPGDAGLVTIAALTADGLAATVPACRAAGIDGLLMKPLAIGEGLGAAVRAAVAAGLEPADQAA